MTSTAAPASNPRGRAQFLLLATLFFVPLMGSYALYFWFPEYRPTGRTNYGELVDPARPLPGTLRFLDARGGALDLEAFRGRWTYVVTAGSDCEETCLHKLVMTRQVRLAMNEKRSRIQRVLLVGDAAAAAPLAARLAPEHPDLRVLVDAGDPGARLADVLQPSAAAAYLVDPNGNWMMVYPAGRELQTDFKGMQNDIKRLLKLSQIG